MAKQKGDFGYYTNIVQPDGHFNCGHTKDSDSGKELRTKLALALMENIKLGRAIDRGDLILIVINKLHYQHRLFDDTEDLIKLSAKCEANHLNKGESAMAFLIFRQVEEDKLAGIRGITEKQAEEILSKLYHKFGLTSFFQFKMYIMEYISEHVFSAA